MRATNLKFFFLSGLVLFSYPSWSLNACEVIHDKVLKWKGHDFDWSTAHFSPSEVDKTFAILNDFKFPEAVEVTAAEQGMQKDIRMLSAYSQRVASSDCVADRKKLMMGLVATASASSQDIDSKARAKIKATLSAILRRPKFATYLAAATDGAVLAFGVQKNLWKVDVETHKKLEHLENEITNEVHNARVGSADLWRKFDNRTYWSSSNEDLQKLRPYVFEEIQASHRFFSSIEDLLTAAK